MKNFTIKSLSLFMLCTIAQLGNAQNPVYKLIDDASGTAGKDFLVTIEWPASSSYTNVTLDNAFVGVLYSVGTTLTRTNVKGSWSNSTSITKATINAVCGSSVNPDDYAFQFYNLASQHQFGNRVSGGSDTLFKLQSSTALSSGKIQLITNTSPASTVDACLYSHGVKNTGTIDPAYPSISTGFDIVGTGGTLALPVELLYFTGEWAGQDAKLLWSTASEQNNAGFLIERSFNGEHFEAVSALIPSKSRSGNSNEVQTYTWIDPDMKSQLSGQVYYKLHQLDFDGKTESFGPVVLTENSKAQQTVNVFPNPSSDVVNVHANFAKGLDVELTLLDMTGRVVTRLDSRTNDHGWVVPVSHLDRGFYHIRLLYGNQEINKKIVVR